MSDEKQEIRLNDNDLKPVKRSRLQKIFPSSTVALAILFIALIAQSMSGSANYLFLISFFLSLVCGYVVFRILTRLHDIDLREKLGTLYEVEIEDRVFKQVYEPGSASLGGVLNFFLHKKLKWFRYENKRLDVYYIIIEGERIDLGKDEYNAIIHKTHLIIKRAKQTDIYLGYEKGRMAVPGGGLKAFPTISAEDVGEISAQVVMRDDLNGRRIRLTGPKAYSFPEVAKLMTDISGRQIKHLKIPLFTINVVSFVLLPFTPFVRYLYKSLKLLNNFPSDVAAEVPRDHKVLRELFDYEPVSLEMEIEQRIKENRL